MTETIRRISLLLALALLSGNAWSLQRIEADPDQAMQITASMDDANVISISGGSIESGWSTEDKVTLDKNEDTGQIIFKPTSAQPFTLFVQSESGETYTLSVVPRKDIIGQVIVIDEFNAQGEVGAQRAFNIIAFKTEIKRLLKQIEQDPKIAVPRLRGFRLRMVNRKVPLWRETEIVHALSWRRSDLVIERYLVTNRSEKPLRFNEREFHALAEGIRAISLRKLELQPAETTVLYAFRSLR